MFKDSQQTRKALVIGLNYKHSAVSPLNGCINDTKTIEEFLKNNHFNDKDIQICTDHNGQWGSYADILHEIKQLADFGIENPNALIWLSFSGHGAQTHKSYDFFDEDDLKNEGFVPTDYYTNRKLVTDDELFTNLISKLHSTNKVFALIDACHSQTMLDLPLIYRSSEGKIVGNEALDLPEVFMLSGCMDSQYSADAFFAGAFEGALTFSFMKIMNEAKELNHNLTAEQMSPLLVSYLRGNNFFQKPTFSFSRADTYEKTLFPNRDDFKPNIYIELKGDQWSQFETSFSLQRDTGEVILQDAAFHMRNELIKLHLQLENGNYVLHLRDAVSPGMPGDGGVQNGKICFFDEDGVRGVIKKFDLSEWDNSSKQIMFVVDSTKDTLPSQTYVEVIIDLDCDYWCDELSYNIEDVRGCNVFKNDKTFSRPYENQLSKHLLPKGDYILKLKCSYGDGGVTGKVSSDGSVLANINWKNLNWHYENGYLHYIQFSI